MIKKLLVICLIFILIIFSFIFFSCSKTSSNISLYLKTGSKIDTNAKDVMPNLDELPMYKDISYKYTHKSEFIFESNSVCLVVKYDDKTYKSEKDKLDNEYIFLDEKENYNVSELIPQKDFTIDSYKFRVVAGDNKDNTYFPKSFGMIASSDKEKSIAYLYFYDFDLDYISEKGEKNPMPKFVKKNFKYKF